MGQLQAKPARLRAFSLLLRFSEGSACQCDVVVIFVSRHFARWSKKKERMLVVDRPAEVLNFEQKQLLVVVVFFYLYAIIYLD